MDTHTDTSSHFDDAESELEDEFNIEIWNLKAKRQQVVELFKNSRCK